MLTATITKLKVNHRTKGSYLHFLQQRINILHFRETIQIKYRCNIEICNSQNIYIYQKHFKKSVNFTNSFKILIKIIITFSPIRIKKKKKKLLEPISEEYRNFDSYVHSFTGNINWCFLLQNNEKFKCAMVHNPVISFFKNPY